MVQKLRCAIYTRKSSEEGLDQEFNSLHAQREACEAYVKSQVGEGWQPIAKAYDDGAFSGGNMERPALKQLLADVEAGRIDIVVVYKVDRLTRSLADFAKIVEVFDARGVSFVSVTQAFNTTTSMGRLTLNVLLSFAQFEREVTGERIRDKVAASKAKGMWMGGRPSLGYDVRDRALIINEEEASVIRHIFQRYLEVDSVRELVDELAAAGVRSKAWVTPSGQEMGGAVMRHGAVFHILSSQLYLGKITHRDKIHAGLHQPIISQDLFDAVAKKLSIKAVRRRGHPGRSASGVLRGLLFDGAGRLLGPTFGYGKKGRLYRYYAVAGGQSLRSGRDNGDLHSVSAPAVEGFLLEQLQRLVTRPDIEIGDLRRYLSRVELRADETHVVLKANVAFEGEHPTLALATLQRRLFDGEQAVLEGPDGSSIRIALPRRLKLRGGRSWVVGAAQEHRGKINPRLVKALRNAHENLLALHASPFTPADDLVAAASPGSKHGQKMSQLALLAPALQHRILQGKHPHDLSVGAFLKGDAPLAWADQSAWLEEISRDHAS